MYYSELLRGTKPTADLRSHRISADILLRSLRYENPVLRGHGESFLVSLTFRFAYEGNNPFGR